MGKILMGWTIVAVVLFCAWLYIDLVLERGEQCRELEVKYGEGK